MVLVAGRRAHRRGDGRVRLPPPRARAPGHGRLQHVRESPRPDGGVLGREPLARADGAAPARVRGASHRDEPARGRRRPRRAHVVGARAPPLPRRGDLHVRPRRRRAAPRRRALGPSVRPVDDARRRHAPRHAARGVVVIVEPRRRARAARPVPPPGLGAAPAPRRGAGRRAPHGQRLQPHVHAPRQDAPGRRRRRPPRHAARRRRPPRLVRRRRHGALRGRRARARAAHRRNTARWCRGVVAHLAPPRLSRPAPPRRRRRRLPRLSLFLVFLSTRGLRPPGSSLQGTTPREASRFCRERNRRHCDSPL
mmetsp:Transcript_23541/g.93306  ORF Transcript_23541/g.93306 Transcript_23541/m.93306 type:complete len:309 (-) Transcript_23541:1322-2248(-)